MEALSLSTVIRLWSTAMVSPGLTINSMTVTSAKSPMSGTLISRIAMSYLFVYSNTRRKSPSI